MRGILAVSLMGFVVAAFAADVGEIKVVRGAAHIERGTERLAVRAGMPVQQADKVVTGADGTVGITFADNSLLSIGPDSALAIDRYVFDSTTHAGQFDSTLSKGTLAVISGKMVKQSPEAMRVRTPSSIMGVRGTEFVVKVDDPKK
ncbi:MAG TPA: FecR domain-containing protein [Burkholderiales bacterium]|nr:FecR domain-containing protein [Burkholderiales bacterium]